MSDTPAPTFRAIVELLAHADPKQLQRLRSEFPQYTQMFKQGYTLGAERPSGELDDKRISAIYAFANAGLDTAEAEILRIIRVLTQRTKLSRTIKLVGAIVASVSSVGVISSLALRKTDAALITAVIALISSVATLVGEHLTQPLFGAGKAGVELLGQTLAAENQVRALRLRLLGADLKAAGDVMEFAGLVNGVAANIREVIVFGGIGT